MKRGDKVYISGYTDELWIEDYHTSVSTYGIIQETPGNNAKKVLVLLAEIDGDHNVNVMVRKSKIQLI